MNESAAVNAVYTIIDDAKATLVQGISHSGIAREILHLSKTNLSTPTQYYAVAVYCENAREFSMPGVNSITGVSWTEYSMMVQLADVANIQSHDVLPYETAHGDFRRFRDRVVRLLRDSTKWFPTSSSSPKLRVKVGQGEGDRLIAVENQNFTFSDMEQVEYAMLFSRIAFTLTDHCADSSLLYTTSTSTTTSTTTSTSTSTTTTLAP